MISYLPNYPAELMARAAKIKLFLMDVDGVLTDGKLYFSDQLIESKAFHTRDGFGLDMLAQNGFDTGVISGRLSEATQKRAEHLKMRHIFLGIKDKLLILESLRESLKLSYEQIAFMGDDVPDLTVMSRVGLAVTVADGHPQAKQMAHWITPNSGGHGAVRDVCDLLMVARPLAML